MDLNLQELPFGHAKTRDATHCRIAPHALARPTYHAESSADLARLSGAGKACGSPPATPPTI